MQFDEVKSRMLNFIQVTGIDPKDIAIGAGAALMYHGLRESINDIDISVPVDIFEVLRNGKGQGDVNVISWDDKIDVHIRVNNIGESLPTIWGCFYNLAELIEQKVYLLLDSARPKEKRVQDMEDLIALNKRIQESCLIKTS